MRRLLGLRDLVHDAIDEITNLVEETQESVAHKTVTRTPLGLLARAEPIGRVVHGVDGVRRAVAGVVFESVRGTNRVVQALGDEGIALASAVLERTGVQGWSALAPSRTGGSVTGARLAADAWIDRAESALNGVIGDYLEARGNPLATRMSLRRAGVDVPLERGEQTLALSAATSKVCIFVHGLACSDSVWRAAAPRVNPDARVNADPRVNADGRIDADADARTPLDFGAELESALGFTCFDLRYNTGLRIADNGRALALLLRDLERVYPHPIEQIALVGHSMGGLLVRSAAHYAEVQREPWLARLTHVLSIGSPHFGAPLARASHVLSAVVGWFDTAATQVSAKVLRARSAGIKDLSFGSIIDDALGSDAEASLFSEQPSCPFVPGVAYGYVAARFRPSGAGPFGELLGDLLVHLPSASGQHRDTARHLPFHMGHVIEGAHHVALTTHPDVYRQLERFLTECQPPART